LNWRETTGSTVEVFGFIFDPGQTATITYGASQTYTIRGGTTKASSSTLGLRAYASTLAFTDGENRAGNAATSGLLDALNAELANTPQPSAISLSNASVTEGANLVYNVTLSAATTSTQAYTFSFGGTASSTSDYNTSYTFSNGVTNNLDGTITIPTGVSSFTVTVATIDDAATESTETLILSIGSKSATGNILDNDSPIITTTGTLNAFTTCAGSASVAQSFTVSASNLTTNITIIAPTGFEVSTSSGSGFASSITINQSGGSVSSTTVYARLSTSATGTPSGNITCTSTGATTKNVSASGTVNAVTSITTHPVNRTVSETNNTTFSVSASGVGLSYQWYSNTTNSNSGGTLIGSATSSSYTTSQSVAGTYYYYAIVTGTCSSATSNAATLTVVSASSPNILIGSGSLTQFTACAGTVSAEQSFTVSGSNLTTAIDIAAPTGYEIRQSSGSFSNTVSLALSSGSVTTTTIYIRLKSDASDGASGNIVCTSTGAANQDIATGSATVNALPTISLSSVPNINTIATSFSLPYTATTGSPDQYSIASVVPTTMASFSAVTNATLGSSPISIPAPASSVNTYNFTIIAKNTTTGCSSSSTPFTVQVVKANSTIVVTGLTSFTYNASAQGPTTNTKTGSTGAVTYSYSGVSPTSYSASATAPTAVGTYQVIATLASDANYNDATSALYAFEIVKANSTISVTGLTSFTYNASAQGPAANTKTGSTGAVTYSYSGVSPTVYSASTTAPTAVGTYQVIATLASDANYNGATSALYAFEIVKANSTISVTGLTSFTYNASAQGPATNTKTGSTGAVTYSYSGVSSTTYSASATAPTLVGTYQVIASLAGDANYNGATSVAYAFEIVKANSTIVVTGLTSFAYNASAQGPGTNTKTGSTGAVTYSYSGVSPTVYSASATAPTEVGTYQVVASLAGDANYNSAVSTPYAFNIVNNISTITVTGLTSYTYNGSAQGPATNTKTGSTGAVTYSYSGVSPTVYSASVTAPTEVGTYQVIASLASDANFPAATSAAYGFTIIPAASTILVTGATIFSYNGNSQGPSTNTKTGSTGVVTYNYQGTGTTSYGPSTVAPTNAGAYEVVATLAADANFNGSISAAYTFTIQKIDPTVVLANIVKVMGDPSFSITATSNSNGAIAYSIGTATVATISGNNVSLVGLGISTITVTQAESINYNAGSTTATLTVTPAAPITNNGTYVLGSSGNPTNTNLLITPAPGATINFYPSATGGSPTNTQTIPNVVGVYTFYVSQTISGIEGPRVAYVVTILPEIKTRNATYIISGSKNPANISSLVSFITSGSKPQWCDVSGNNCSSVAPALPTTAGTYIWCVKAIDTISGLASAPCIYDTVRMLPTSSVMSITKVASKPLLNPDGTFTLQYKFTVSNLSSDLLDSVQVTDDLRSVLVSPVTYEIISLKVGTKLTANASYNGNTQINLLGYPSKLLGLESDTVLLVVKISPRGYSGSINNTALISGVSPYSGRVGPVLSNDPSNLNNTGSNNPTISILPSLKIVIPSGFSPNNDGINDNFAIIHPYNSSISLEVFNRWGNIVYKNGNYNNEWYGKGVGNFMGQDLPAGTYYYIVNATDKTNNQVSNFVGYLILKR